MILEFRRWWSHYTLILILALTLPGCGGGGKSGSRGGGTRDEVFNRAQIGRIFRLCGVLGSNRQDAGSIHRVGSLVE